MTITEIGPTNAEINEPSEEKQDDRS